MERVMPPLEPATTCCFSAPTPVSTAIAQFGGIEEPGISWEG